MSRRWPLVAALAALALSIGPGCGEGDGEGADGDRRSQAADEREVLRVLGEMGAALGDARFAKACELMTSGARREFVAPAPKELVGGADGPIDACARVLPVAFGSDVIEDTDPPIVRTRIDGDRAVVTARPSHDDELQRARLRYEDGRWRVVHFYMSRTLNE